MSVIDSYRLDGQAAIVTGGNRGIGYAIARGLAEAGADVVIANRDEESGRVAADELTGETGSEVTRSRRTFGTATPSDGWSI